MAERRKHSSTTTKRPLVLVVDDHADTRELITEFFRFKGYRIAEASTGPEALKLARATMPDVVLMDLSLPELDGWEVTRRLKEDARTSHMFVVAVSGHADRTARERALDVGCDDYCTKPCLPDELVAVVEKLLLRAGQAGNGPA